KPMKRVLWRKSPLGAAAVGAIAAWQLGPAGSALAQQPVLIAPPAPAPEAPASTAMTTPSMAGPLVANPNPYSFDDPFGYFGKIYVTGALTGLALVQSNPVPGDHLFRGDASNAQVIVQKPEGLFQFYVQAGMYSFPALGTPYVSAWRTTGDTFTPLLVAYAKLAPSDEFSIQAGKLPTLIGAEYAFTFQNMNIERGLLWNQEPIVSRGVQANYTLGPLAFSASLNDGFYSDSYNWLTGSAAWTINKENTLTIVGGGNFDHTDKNVISCKLLNCLVKTPWFQNNGSIFNAIYTYNSAPWTFTPYFQYTNVPGNAFLGAPKGASTYGGAFLANYSFTDNWNLSGRWEYIASTGSLANGNANLLYGPGSDAFSFTLTPTWQLGVGFVRGEASIVKAFSSPLGFAFGRLGNTSTQARFLLEAGVFF